MSSWVTVCSRAYRRVARAFPDQFRAICGDGLEQLGEDLVPRVWQQQGVVGLIRLFGDLALRLPCEYFSTWTGKLREATMADDVFEGTWRARQRGFAVGCRSAHAAAGLSAVRAHRHGLSDGGIRRGER